jgi:hypothetical protein
MPANEGSLRETLEHYRSQREAVRQELRELDYTIRRLERDLGEESQEPYSVEMSNPPWQPSAQPLQPSERKPATNGKPSEVRPDEFFGKTHSDAARTYLTKVGHAVALEELLDVLRRGGCKIGGADPKRVLYISLIRNTKDYVAVQNGYIGLREFYPNLKQSNSKDTNKKKLAGKKAQKGKKLVAKGGNKSKPAPSKPTGKPVKATVFDVLKDEQPHSFADVLKVVKSKLGQDISNLAVQGVLNNSKDIERAGDQFKLKAKETEKEKGQAAEAAQPVVIN